MLFNSYEFLFAFLPLVLGLYYALRPRARVVMLTIASYLFYGWWDYRFCSLMLISTLIDYVAGGRIARESDPRRKRRWVAVSVCSNLAMLGFFKYFDLFAGTLNHGLAALLPGVSWRAPLLDVVLPVGISFYTFQSMSYSIDLYRGDAKPARSLLDFACYVALFPQLIAGPIIRYRSLADQLVERTHTIDKFALGIALFVCGLAKKVLLADSVARLVPLAFDRSVAPDFVHAWLGVLGYTMQIYFDFSGYSDMAVGLGLMIGFTFPQNFNSPYKAASITEFWRRWHISLSTWLRDYLYIPLGGNRISPSRTYVNLIVTMLLGGLWHGANWTFVLWGAFHGVLLAIERALEAGDPRRGRMARRALTFLLVMVGWVLFRASSAGETWRILGGMAGLHGWGQIDAVWAEGGALAFAGLIATLLLAFGSPNAWQVKWRFSLLQIAGLLALFIASVATIMVNTSSPFLYFQF
jgi:alginate O-acetyltransferase complex protein AlgI